MYTIYRITNLINRKSYIGQTQNYELRQKQHINTAYNEFGKQYNNNLYKDIRKYGLENFKFDILCTTDDSDIAYLLEDLLIKEFNTLVDQNGYNNNYGGLHGKHSKTTKQKIIPFIKKTGIDNISFGKKGCNAFASKKVINKTTGKIYNSIKECAISEYGDSKYSKEISKVCHPTYNRFSYKGNEYRLIDENNNIIEKQIANQQTNQFNKTQVIETFSGHCFNSITECAKFYNLSVSSIRDRLYKRIKNDKYKNYYNFEFVK